MKFTKFLYPETIANLVNTVIFVKKNVLLFLLLIFTFLLSGYPALLSNENFYDASACLLKRTKEFENIQHAIDLDQKYFTIQIKRDRSQNDKRVVHRVATSDNE